MKDLKDVLASAKATVMYPCAGDDFKPLVFTTREFLEYRTNGEITFHEPDYFVYIDNNMEPYYKERSNLDCLYANDDTEINMQSISPLKSGFKNATLYTVELVSKNKPAWSPINLAPRTKNVIFVDADWRDFAAYRHINNIPAYMGIGVTDGCNFGGNSKCVNDLVLPRSSGKISYDDLKKIYGQYWITDHFTHYKPFETLYNGEYVESIQGDFPVKFKKLALLSSSWGNYGYPPSLRGATLFKIEPAGR